MVGVKSWEHLWHFPSPLGRFSFPSLFPWRIPGARVSIPGSACVSAPRSRSASPFGSVVFGLAGGEKQDFLIPYLLQLPRNLLGLDTACWAVWAGRHPRTPPCSWERWPWRRQNPGAALCWHGRGAGTGMSQEGAVQEQASSAFAGESTVKAKKLSFKELLQCRSVLPASPHKMEGAEEKRLWNSRKDKPPVAGAGGGKGRWVTAQNMLWGIF